MKTVLAIAPFAIMLVSFSIVLATAAHASNEASRGKFENAAPSATVAILTCCFLGLAVFALQRSHKSGMFKSAGGGGGSMSMPTSKYASS
jgi:cbb3-type cytochrome oxidase subunit 3